MLHRILGTTWTTLLVLSMGALALSAAPAVPAVAQNAPPPSHPQPKVQIPEWARAIGRVRMSSNYGGSCTLFAVDGEKGYVITNQHVVGSGHRAVVTFPTDPNAYSGKVTWRVPGADAAVILISAPPGIQPLALAHRSEMPQPGDEVMLAGWGGSGTPKLTLWRGIAQGAGSRRTDIAAKTNLISGDSGGAQVFGGKLVGVNWGWTGHTERAEAVGSPYIIEQLAKRQRGRSTSRT